LPNAPVLTVRTELTGRILLIFGERHLRSVLTRYGAHYNGRRPHRALRLIPPRPDHPAPNHHHQRSGAGLCWEGCSTRTNAQPEIAGQGPIAEFWDPTGVGGSHRPASAGKLGQRGRSSGSCIAALFPLCPYFCRINGPAATRRSQLSGVGVRPAWPGAVVRRRPRPPLSAASRSSPALERSVRRPRPRREYRRRAPRWRRGCGG
jgi:hypothetical protein